MKNGLFEVKGAKYHILNDKLHREDGPAIEYDNGDKYWLQNSKWHRLDGPAIECSSGMAPKQWWVNGHYIKCETQEEFERLLRLKAFL